jgi:type IV fimbrial biogenesis protein FimT
VLGNRPAGQDDPSRIVGFNRGKTVVPGKQRITRTHFIARLRARCRACGFTLIELMVTLAVAAILAMIAVPSFKHILIETHLSDINNDLAGDLQYARTEAVSRQVNVAVAQSGGSWQNGWKVQIPSNSTSATATPTVLRRHPAVPSQYVLKSGTATQVEYQAQGSLVAPASTSAGTCFTISVTNGQNNTPRYLQVLPAGMLQQTTSTTVPTGSGCTAPSP